MPRAGDVLLGDCLYLIRGIAPATCDLIYLDPPFFTGKHHIGSTRDGLKSFSFEDVWAGADEYLDFITKRLVECKRTLKQTGSIFVHADHNNVHLVRHALDFVFGRNNFQSEIIWYYKRWSNARRGLLQAHQNILFYSVSSHFKWRETFVDYSATTNIDQIMQKRSRDKRGKAVYATGENGHAIVAAEKKGVPLSDVWEIPFLNPKANERTGYPTQKPLLLLERIVELTTSEGDLVLDPFCGSGTTLVAAKLKNRKYIGFDIRDDAIKLTVERLANPIRTESALLRKGIGAYVNKDSWVESHLAGVPHRRVQRNLGIDALLKESLNGKPCFLRVQRAHESLSQALFALKKAISTKGEVAGIIIATGDELFQLSDPDIIVIASACIQLRKLTQVSRLGNSTAAVAGEADRSEQPSGAGRQCGNPFHDQ
jgi:site-specific DNA-methyltransferase (adenine-specific)